MPRLLDRLPIPAAPSEVVVRGERVRLRADQIILWVTLTLRRVTVPNPSARPFPAILDTGHSHTFSIQERQLAEWAGLHPDALTVVGAVRDRGQRVVLRAANVWAHPNAPGSRDPGGRPAHVLAAPRGIAVYPGGDFPRLQSWGCGGSWKTT
jgi:hypothetical protein